LFSGKFFELLNFSGNFNFIIFRSLYFFSVNFSGIFICLSFRQVCNFIIFSYVCIFFPETIRNILYTFPVILIFCKICTYLFFFRNIYFSGKSVILLFLNKVYILFSGKFIRNFYTFLFKFVILIVCKIYIHIICLQYILVILAQLCASM